MGVTPVGAAQTVTLAVHVAELVVERGQGLLQPVMREGLQRVESTLHPGGLAPTRLRNETMG